MLRCKLRQLIAEGTPVLAVVTKCSRSSSSGGFLVKYEFHVGDGKVIKGAGWCENRQETGSNIWIVYLPQNPQVSRPYPMLNFRVATSQ